MVAPMRFEMPKPPVNEQIRLVAVPVVRGVEKFGPEGSKGTYRSVFVLSIPGMNQTKEHLDIDSIALSGDSQLKMPDSGAPSLSRTFNDRTYNIELCANKAGRVSHLVVVQDADSFKDAEATAYSLVLTVLSELSFQYDMAMEVAVVHTQMESTGAFSIEAAFLGEEKVLRIGDLGSTIADARFRSLLASYREGNNSNNPFYRFLCYFRAFEGLKVLRAKRVDAQRATGKEATRFVNEKLPLDDNQLPFKDPAIRDRFKPYLGQGFIRVFESHSSAKRHAVAHLSIDPEDGEILSFDDHEQLGRYLEHNTVLRHMLRIMLRNEISVASSWSS